MIERLSSAALMPPIAVVGMACRVPGAADPEQLWQLLEAGGEAQSSGSIGEPDGPPIKRLNGSSYFDWRTFGLSPKESVAMDPQQKLLLELAWEAFADAGVCRREIGGRQVAVVIGAMWHDHMQKVAAVASEHEGYEISASTPAFLAARVSHVFDLRGPAHVLDAGCASSLLATIDACRMLATGEAELAIAGGVNMIQARDSTDMMTKAGLLSPSGRCRPLDARADGFVRGEGGALVVLKRAADVAPGDRVYCVIRGWAAGQCGRADWIMAPVPEVQQSVIGSALSRAGVAPEQIDYVEVNGTGFARGDAVEIRALSAALRADGRTRPCFVGSLKSNLGHLEAASGVASLLKVALALHRRRRPASINVEHQNDIFYAVQGVEIQRELTPWKESDGTRFAGISSLSYSGSNAHLVVQGVEPAERRSRVGRASLPLGISAGTRAALEVLVARYLSMLEGPSAPSDSALVDVCYTACLRREHRAWRLAVCGRTTQELSAALRAAALPSSPTARVVFWVPETRRASESFWRTALSGLASHEWFREPLASASPEVIAATLCRESGVSHALLPYLLLARWQQFGIEGYPVRVQSTEASVAELEAWLIPSRFAALTSSSLAQSSEGGVREGDEVLIALADPAGLTTPANARTLICPDFSDVDACTAALAELYKAGCAVRWESSVPAGCCVSLPAHPWVASTPSNERTPPSESPRRSDPSRGEARQHSKRRRLLSSRLVSAARRVLGHSDSEPLSLTRPLFELGFTSISLAALRVELERELRCQLSVARLLYCRTLQEVTELLFELGAELPPADVASLPSVELGN